MSEIVVAVMACFMVLGAADKALFSGRLGYGEEFEKGLGAMGPLSMSMVGIMCAAPSIGAFLGPALTPFFTAIGSGFGRSAARSRARENSRSRDAFGARARGVVWLHHDIRASDLTLHLL